MAESSYENLRYAVEERAAWITIHRPEKLNALNRRTVEELGRAAEAALADPGVGALLVTGAGEKAFVAGADIAEMAGLTPYDSQEFSRRLHRVLWTLERATKPVVAVVNGFALGGGLELAMACHVRLASDTAQFGQPEVTLGLIPGAGGTQRLPRLVGRGRALDLILTGDLVDAQEAWRLGLVNRVLPAASLKGEAASYAAKLLSRSPAALARALEAVHGGAEMPLGEALRFESALFGLCFATEDLREGTRAFLEKRKARFTGK